MLFKGLSYYPLLFICCLFVSISARHNHAPGSTILAGCTPADSTIKSWLRIPSRQKVEFFRWNISLDSSTNSAQVHVQYGIGKPNTLGFMPGASEKTIKATFDGSDVLTLRSSQLAAPLRLLKIGDWVFHLLDTDEDLMVGNGGYSYTLNRQPALSHSSQNQRLNLFSRKFMHRLDSVMTFDGRTPCQPFGQDYRVTTGSACLKIKWRLILHTFPVSGKPAGFRLMNRAMSPKEIVGNWSVDPSGNTEVLRLDGENGTTLYFLFIDPNVLFMLDQQRNLLVGNEHFSFTLNRVP